jgi:hypothetical protein
MDEIRFGSSRSKALWQCFGGVSGQDSALERGLSHCPASSARKIVLTHVLVRRMEKFSPEDHAEIPKTIVI